jgi:hypothetical protein
MGHAQVDPTVVHFRFELTVLDKGLQNLMQVNVLDLPGRGVAFGSGQLEQLVNQAAKPVGLLANPRQRRLAVRTRPRQLDGEVESGQG